MLYMYINSLDYYFNVCSLILRKCCSLLHRHPGGAAIFMRVDFIYPLFCIAKCSSIDEAFQANGRSSHCI
jgi:hypothetical protein